MTPKPRVPYRLLGTLLLAALLLTACTAPQATTQPANAPQAAAQTEASQADTEPTETELPMGEYVVITAQKAKQIMDNETGVTVVDVREPYEYQEGHIPGAVSLPLGDISTKAATVLPDQNATVMVYCYSGARSQSAARTLLSLGYTHVLDFGGIMNWPYDVTQ